MQQIIAQLESIRRRGRLLLVVRRVAQWLAVLVGVVIGLVLLDYVLRLPGWMRLVLGLVTAGLAGMWLTTRLFRAIRFNPDLSLLALRIERIYPQLTGKLASAVDFASHESQYRNPEQTYGLTQQSIAQTRKDLEGVNVSVLINPTHAVRNGAYAAGAIFVIVLATLLAPSQATLAAKRWLLPLGDTQWPRRVNLTSTVQAGVWPDDTPLELVVNVEKGYHENMRTWVTYRIVSADGTKQPWNSLLMSEQTAGGEDQLSAGTFKRLIDLGATEPGSASAAGSDAVVEFYFQADDDQTETQTIEIVQRPAVEAVICEVTPPAYAKDFVETRLIDLARQAGPIVGTEGLIGSRVRISVQLNKPLTMSAETLRTWMPGLAEAPISNLEMQSTGGRPGFSFDIQLQETLLTTIDLVDEYGLESVLTRQYRVTAIEDAPAIVSMAEPLSGEAVLPSAEINLRGVARDDVAISSVALEQRVSVDRAQQQQQADDEASADEEAAWQRIDESTGLSEQLEVAYLLKLSPYELKPGQVMEISALAQDNFELDGRTHPPTRSTIRRLRIIDEVTLISQLRGELAGVQQTAVRLNDRQGELTAADADKSRPGQQQMSRNLAAQQTLIKSLQQRAERNRLDEPELNQTLAKVSRLLGEAEAASQQAATKLDEAEAENRPADQAQQSEREAREAQQQVSDRLTEVAQLLDQGKDAIALQMQVRQIEAMQRALLSQTEKLMPRTLGQSREQLEQAERNELDDIIKRQEGLAERTSELLREMQETADQMKRDANADRTTAEMMEEAVKQAQEQQLSQQMQQAAESANENQLSRTAEHQEQSLQTLNQMLGEARKQDERRREILKRQLAQLEEQLARLLAQQKTQHDLLQVAEQLPDLAEGQSQLRRNTMAAEQDARSDAQTSGVAGVIRRGVEHQGEAVVALRKSDKPVADEQETQAISALDEALRMVREARDQQQEEQNREQRQEMRDKYLAMATQQDDLRAKTEPFAEVDELSRREIADVIRLGNEEAELRAAIRELTADPQVSSSLVFNHLHDRIDTVGESVVRSLRAGQPDDAALRGQDDIAAMLRRMATALEQEENEEDFMRSPGDESQGGGGGGGGSGGQPPLIPPTAELRLLKELQLSVLEQTRISNESPRSSEMRSQRRMMQLASEQQDLARLGEALVERMQTGGPQVVDPSALEGEGANDGEGDDAGPGDQPDADGAAPEREINPEIELEAEPGR